MTRSIRQALTVAVLALSLSACLVDRVKVADDKGDSSTNSSIVSMDASHDSSATGGEASASTGSEGGSASTSGTNGTNGTNGSTGDAQANGDAGELECSPACDTIEASKCDTKGQCVRCSVGDDCKHLKATPACLPETGCVECVFEDNTTKCMGKTPHCSNDDVLANKCVECNLASHCGDDAPLCIDHKCVSCEKSPIEACQGRKNKICEPVSGACVECDKDDRTACKDSANNPTVCDVLEHVCTDKRLLSASDCDECVADEQCAAGHLCRPMPFPSENLGYFCLPTKQVAVPCAQPYTEFVSTGTSIEGDETDICSLAVSTCAAHDDYKKKVCGVDALGHPVATNAQGPDNSLCGAANVDDGFCVLFGDPSDKAYRCTVECGNFDDDCPAITGVTCDDGSTPDLCTL